MKLLAYKIDEKVINRDIFNWSVSQLDGNKPWIVSETDIENYEDITSIENWDKLCTFIDKDFLFIRQRMKDILDVGNVDKNGDYSTYSDRMTFIEGQISSRYFLINKSKRDIYLSEQEQTFWWGLLVEKSQQSRSLRWEKAKTYISYKLDAQTSSDLAISTSELCNNYINYNIISKAKDDVSGLFDYLRGIEDYSTTGYPSKTYWNQQDQDKLLDILENGNY